MRGVLLTACSLVSIGLLGFACDNDPNVLPTGPTGPGGSGGDTTTGMGGDTTTTANGGNNTGGNEGGGGAGGDGGDGGAGGMVVITDCVEDLNPQEIGHDDIIISEISIGNYIEVYNASNETKSLGGVAYQAWRWCAQPSYPTLQSTAVGISLPPGAYRTIPWPSLNVGDNATGELALYDSANYGEPDSVMDYVCWGNGIVGGTEDRKDEAELANEWTGACAASTTNGVLRRLLDNTGDAAAHWDSTVTADPTNCDQP